MKGELRLVDDVPTAFREVVAEAWQRRAGDGFTMAVSGGETARHCYESLAAWREAPVDWMQTEIYWGDERCVPLTTPTPTTAWSSESLLRGVGGVHALFPMRCDEGEDDAYHLLVSALGTIDLVAPRPGHRRAHRQPVPRVSCARRRPRTSRGPQRGPHGHEPVSRA